MHIYFSGIGGVGLGPLAEIALSAGYTVSGSELTNSPMTEQLERLGVTIQYTQDGNSLADLHRRSPIDWLVYSAAVPVDHPERQFAESNGIHTSKRDELLLEIIDQHHLKLIAVAGTHGKTSTTGMLVWAFEELGIPVSYSVGSSLSFGPSGQFEPKSEYFVYECDEYDRNMLQFSPYVSVITSLDYDHPDTYKNEHVYKKAFAEFMRQSATTLLWEPDRAYLDEPTGFTHYSAFDTTTDLSHLTLVGDHMRRNSFLVQQTFALLFPGVPNEQIVAILNAFPGTGRRFEKLGPNLYSDYGHHPTEIAATLQMAHELNKHIILVYQPHQNIRQHQLRGDYTDEVFAAAETVYWLPTYLSREDTTLDILTPEQLTSQLSSGKVHTVDLGMELWDIICRHQDSGHLVLVMGAGSIDTWLRQQLAIKRSSEILVIYAQKNFLLQHRDNKPGLTNPDKLTTFGGAAEAGETPRQTALRELSEETSLTISEHDLAYLAAIYQPVVVDGTSRWAIHFSLHVETIDNFAVYEGQGFVVVPMSDTAGYNLSDTTRQAIAVYSKNCAATK